MSRPLVERALLKADPSSQTLFPLFLLCFVPCPSGTARPSTFQTHFYSWTVQQWLPLILNPHELVLPNIFSLSLVSSSQLSHCRSSRSIKGRKTRHTIWHWLQLLKCIFSVTPVGCIVWKFCKSFCTVKRPVLRIILSGNLLQSNESPENRSLGKRRFPFIYHDWIGMK